MCECSGIFLLSDLISGCSAIPFRCYNEALFQFTVRLMNKRRKTREIFAASGKKNILQGTKQNEGVREDNRLSSAEESCVISPFCVVTSVK